MASTFLQRGCSVLVNGRTPAAVEQAVQALSVAHPRAAVRGLAGDAARIDDHWALWAEAQRAFGRVDIWINNAGVNTSPTPFWEHAPKQIETVIQTNLLGTMLGTKVAVEGMLQQGHGAIYNMEGLGSTGRIVPGLALYASSKAGLRYFDDAMALETRGLPVLFGMLSPGMVLTDMLRIRQSERDWAQTKRIFNILADRVETVAPWLVDQMLANRAHGKRIAWLTQSKILWRFLSAPITRRNLFDETTG
jgi:NAD(P)-dependent dehydrogenase (short-subunit alcohol dehydrogenase family)